MAQPFPQARRRPAQWRWPTEVTIAIVQQFTVRMPPGFRRALLVACALLLPIGGADKVRGAIVTLTHGTLERMELLSRAISSVNKAFNSRLQYPIVIFLGISHGEKPEQLPKREWLDSLADQTTARLIFAEVNFTDYYYSAPHSANTPASVEGFGRGYRDMCRCGRGFAPAAWDACAHAHGS